MANVFTRQEGTYLFATCTAEVTGDSVYLRNGSVVSGASVAGMTEPMPLHVRRVYRLL